jgi:hypothetical protein
MTEEIEHGTKLLWRRQGRYQKSWISPERKIAGSATAVENHEKYTPNTTRGRHYFETLLQATHSRFRLAGLDNCRRRCSTGRSMHSRPALPFPTIDRVEVLRIVKCVGDPLSNVIVSIVVPFSFEAAVRVSIVCLMLLRLYHVVLGNYCCWIDEKRWTF